MKVTVECDESASSALMAVSERWFKGDEFEDAPSLKEFPLKSYSTSFNKLFNAKIYIDIFKKKLNGKIWKPVCKANCTGFLYAKYNYVFKYFHAFCISWQLLINRSVSEWLAIHPDYSLIAIWFQMIQYISAQLG